MSKKDYIKNGKPKLNSKSKYKQGFYRPKNPSKYKGDVKNIIFRSGLELKWYTYFDIQPAFIEWCCEEVIVPYRSSLDNKLHRYYVDVWVKYINKRGVTKELIIEIKPLIQTVIPKIPKYKGKSYHYNVKQFIINDCKWNAAFKYAEEHNMTFMILTEKVMQKYTPTKD